MGTNYYAVTDACGACGHGEERHIGKSSMGWCFSLHVYPEAQITTLEDWRPILFAATTRIRDEYGGALTPESMMDIITKRSGRGAWSPDYLRSNHAIAGPNGCLRHAMDGRFCIAHGIGPWDCLTGEFS